MYVCMYVYVAYSHLFFFAVVGHRVAVNPSKAKINISLIKVPRVYIQHTVLYVWCEKVMVC